MYVGASKSSNTYLSIFLFVIISQKSPPTITNFPRLFFIASQIKMVVCCGLLTDKKEPVPLKSIEVQLEVKDHVAAVVSTLNYENKEDKPLEAVFVFPLPGDAAVCHFSAQIGETHIVAE
ncbi:hypothetical protein AMECASPLE_038847, partial [Ameca splendens]